MTFNILIVDNEIIQHEIVKFFISKEIKENVEFYFAKNGEEAVNIVIKYNIHFIIMDINMPVCDGIEATQLIRVFNQDVDIYGYSATGYLDSYREKCFIAGMNGMLDKPYRIEYNEIIKRKYDIYNKLIGNDITK